MTPGCGMPCPALPQPVHMKAADLFPQAAARPNRPLMKGPITVNGTELRFVDELPDDSQANKHAPGSFARVAEGLRARPGEWAEIARYDKSRRNSAHSRALASRRRYPNLEHAVREVEPGVVALFMRAVSA